LSGFTAATFGPIGHPPPPTQLGAVQQQLSNMSSVRDFWGNTYFFQINSDQTVSYRSDHDSSGTWHNLGVKALSVSAGRDGSGSAVVYTIALDHSVSEYDTSSEFWGGWKYLGGWAYSISGTQGSDGSPELLYAIGSNGQLYVNATDYNNGWVWLGSPVLNGQHISLFTISALSYEHENALPQSVCYATDAAGDVWEFTLQDPYNPQQHGSWSSMLATNVIQIAASFNSNGDPIVYALSYANGYLGSVWVWDGGWHDLGGYALEISAGRDPGDGFAAPSLRNTFFEIGGNHRVYGYNNSFSSTWGNGYWLELGGYATAITAEAVESLYPNSIDHIFADAFSNTGDHTAYDFYNGYWHGLLGYQLNPSATPIAS
jgi:hypothetical protein